MFDSGFNVLFSFQNVKVKMLARAQQQDSTTPMTLTKAMGWQMINSNREAFHQARQQNYRKALEHRYRHLPRLFIKRIININNNTIKTLQFVIKIYIPLRLNITNNRNSNRGHKWDILLISAKGIEMEVFITMFSIINQVDKLHIPIIMPKVRKSKLLFFLIHKNKAWIFNSFYTLFM